MVRQTSRHRAWIGVGLVTGILAISVGAWGLHEWQPFEDDDEPVAVQWPDNLQPLAAFVEHETGLTFLTPVTVEYLGDDDEYAARTADTSTPTDERRDIAATDEAVGRALGYWSGDVSLIDSARTISDASTFPATWLVDEDALVVHADDEEAELSPSDRSDLVVLLTEMLDDQHYGVAERLRTATTAQDFQALAGVDIGEALWVRDRYIDEFSDDDHAEYEDAIEARGDAYTGAVSMVPLSYRTLRIVAQTLAPGFISALHHEGKRAVADAFTTDVPSAIDQLSLPSGKYLHPDAIEPVEATAVPHGGELRYTRQMGPYGVYLILSSGLSPTEALTAADGWGNDAFTAYDLGGRVCVDARIVADSRADADRLQRGFDAWASTRAPASGALVGRDGNDLLLSVCDPGVDARQPSPGQPAIDQYFGRSAMLEQQIEETRDPAVAECVAVTFFERFTVAQASTFDPDFDVTAEIDDITDDCRASV